MHNSDMDYGDRDRDGKIFVGMDRNNRDGVGMGTIYFTVSVTSLEIKDPIISYNTFKSPVREDIPCVGLYRQASHWVHLKNCIGQENLKISGHFKDIKSRKHAEKVPLKSSKL